MQFLTISLAYILDGREVERVSGGLQGGNEGTLCNVPFQRYEKESDRPELSKQTRLNRLIIYISPLKAPVE